MTISVEIIGDQVLQRRLRALADEVAAGKLAQKTKPAADAIAAEAQRLAPQRSGRLAQSIHAAETHRSQSVVEHGISYNPQDAPYGGYVELGTQKMAAQPFLRPAMDARRDATVRAVGQDIRRGITRAKRA